MENLEAPLTIDLNIPPFNGDDYNIKEICQKKKKASENVIHEIFTRGKTERKIIFTFSHNGNKTNIFSTYILKQFENETE